MTRYSVARAARRAFDERLSSVDVAAMRPPRDGWIRAIFEALGMPAPALAARLGVSKQAVYALQASEVSGTIRLESLRRAAAALDCQLVYALVPNTTLEGTVQAEAGRIVDAWASQTAQSNLLEGIVVELSAASRRDAIDDLLRSGRVWGQPR